LALDDKTQNNGAAHHESDQAKGTLLVPESAQFEIETREGARVLVVSGDWTIHTIGELDEVLRPLRLAGDERPTRVDVTGLDDLDTAGAYVIERILGDVDGGRFEIVGEHRAAARLLVEVTKYAQECGKPEKQTGVVNLLLERIGRGIVEVYRESLETLSFLGETVFALGRSVANPKRIRWLPTFAVAESAGLNAVPIVMTLSFFIGAVIAFMGKTILSGFGATIFTVELVGFAVLREFGVLLTAIILAGRSDSSFTAQIGSMKMTQEIDAMRILGLDPIEMLVVPRVLALLVMFPILTFLAMVAGIAGGGLVILTLMDISPTLFLSRIQQNVGATQFWAGMAKAPAFAFVIAIIGCRQGLNVENDVISLGKNTTASVVQALFMVIILEAVFALLYMELNI
jgi:phospholipid/cholesterol/gamma-HCH transport system permease protein